MIELLEYLRFDTKEYENFTINEIDAMLSTEQLDMLVTVPNNSKKTYVKYYLAKQIRPKNLKEIIEDLYEIESILTKQDTLIIIIEDEPNDTIITEVKYLFQHSGIFVVIHNIHRLQYNILRHNLVPECTIIEEETEIENLKKTYNISSDSQFPEISRFDPQALAICLRPSQICKFKRKSSTALYYDYYRICV
jgi:DNA-directed RNA polymerase subunit H (RpoH/RPB5)